MRADPFNLGGLLRVGPRPEISFPRKQPLGPIKLDFKSGFNVARNKGRQPGTVSVLNPPSQRRTVVILCQAYNKNAQATRACYAVSDGALIEMSL